MTEKEQKNTDATEVVTEVTDAAGTKKSTPNTPSSDGAAQQADKATAPKKGTDTRRPHSKNRRPRGKKRGNTRRPAPEFIHQVIDIRRVTRVMAGGRRFSFSVVLVAGDKKGRVGVGIGKSNDTSLAIDKALRDAKKNMITVPMTEDMSIAHEVEAKYASAFVRLYPSPVKGGVTAGGAMRSVLDFAGVQNVGAKIMTRSKNKLNNAKATLLALQALATPENAYVPPKKMSTAKKVSKKRVTKNN